MYCFPFSDRTFFIQSRIFGDKTIGFPWNIIAAGIPPVMSRRIRLSSSSLEYIPVIADFVVNASPAPIARPIYPGFLSSRRLSENVIFFLSFTSSFSFPSTVVVLPPAIILRYPA
ncbi:hypothetical protein MT325_m373L [Paramecium bursaria chlorella virus MT325]|uniref:Uncharacterized protein m373L n=2 Tax=Paramecium bursaria Chlorella virus A1 TaxID=381899 RepID=A7IUA3_PBCVM|nr:hypothetical protein FR483_n384L [Paramecium bursaria Chlorella virus FR483]ABT13927.1 hypothetical protein MT325_m373L [Paramecium bursaria chlorella virus MT325]ABT15669.1 hypothetical protein FR483_n384L [Paramecium bursaria Chlorella virus FR483]